MFGENGLAGLLSARRDLLERRQRKPDQPD
jgi:hypothetical protein